MKADKEAEFSAIQSGIALVIQKIYVEQRTKHHESFQYAALAARSNLQIADNDALENKRRYCTGRPWCEYATVAQRKPQ